MKNLKPHLMDTRDPAYLFEEVPWPAKPWIITLSDNGVEGFDETVVLAKGKTKQDCLNEFSEVLKSMEKWYEQQ